VARLTPEVKEDLLFDDLLFLEKAREEHDRFADLLRSRGVEVLYLADLLTDVLSMPQARAEILTRVVTPQLLGPTVAARLTALLSDAEVSTVRRTVGGGVLWSELDDWGIRPPWAVDNLYALRPVPNLLFMRDNASWIGSGVMVAVPARPARSREAVLLDAIYRHHERFGDPARWYGPSEGDASPASIEGGDVMVLSADTLLVGVSERTTPAAVEILARRLFAGDGVRTVMVAHLPRRRAVMHLDTVFTMVDRATFNVFPGIVDELAVDVLHSGGDGWDVERGVPIEAAIRDVLGVGNPAMIPTGGDAIGRLREQWDDGNNTLAVAPGVVVAYQRNRETNRRLREAGIEVLEFEAGELCRGRGGSRCMAQPVVRDPV